MLAERLSVSESPGIIGSEGQPMGGVSRRIFTSAEYHAMGEAGILSEDERVELIAGEILKMTPIGARHVWCVNFLTGELVSGLQRRAVVSVQNPVELSEGMEPQPDLVVLRPRADGDRQSLPRPADVLLIIEVAETSSDYDRRIKSHLYAQAGIPETWVVHLSQGAIEVYRNPSEMGYREVRTLRAGDRVSPQAFPDLELTVDAILG